MLSVQCINRAPRQQVQITMNMIVWYQLCIIYCTAFSLSTCEMPQPWDLGSQLLCLYLHSFVWILLRDGAELISLEDIALGMNPAFPRRNLAHNTPSTAPAMPMRDMSAAQADFTHLDSASEPIGEINPNWPTSINPYQVLASPSPGRDWNIQLNKMHKDADPVSSQDVSIQAVLLREYMIQLFCLILLHWKGSKARCSIHDRDHDL